MTTQEVHTTSRKPLTTAILITTILFGVSSAAAASTWNDSLNEARRIAQINQNWTVLSPNAAPTVAELSSPDAPAIALGKRY